jgi:hypothetical protein
MFCVPTPQPCLLHFTLLTALYLRRYSMADYLRGMFPNIRISPATKNVMMRIKVQFCLFISHTEGRKTERAS